VTIALSARSRYARGVSWRKLKTVFAAPADDGPARLESLACELGNRVASVLRTELEVGTGEPVRHTGLALNASDRLWHCDFQGVRIYCALDSDSQRTILGWILGGPGASVPTAVERTIVTECVDQLLSPSAHARWHEFAGLHGGAVWLSVHEISDKSGTATIRVFTAAQAASPPKHHPRLDDVPLDVCAQLRSPAMNLGTLTELKRGMIVRVGDAAPTARVCLHVGLGEVAFGTLGGIDGRRAIRLKSSTTRVDTR
jgi:hypothetical protein